jgi:hypothetical protein
MKIMQISGRILALLLILLLTACAQTPNAKPNPVTQYGDMQFEQAGRLAESDGLSVTLLRSPFTVRFMGFSPSNPWMHASSSSSPVTALTKLKPKELWLVNTQPLERKVKDLRLGDHIIRHDGPATESQPSRYVARLPVNAFDARDAAGRPIIFVDSLSGQSLSNPSWISLYLTVLSDQQKPVVTHGEPAIHTSGKQTLQRVNWSDCTVFFK